MTKISFTRRAASVSMLAATLIASAAVAQPVPQGVIDAKGGAIRVPCCKCVDGSRQSINISTNGTTPWMVTSELPGNSFSVPIKAGVITNPHPAWSTVTTALAPASWVQPSTSNTRGDFANGKTAYQLKIIVPRCTVPMKVSVNGRWWSDDTSNGSISGPNGTASFGSATTAPGQPFNANLTTPGTHVLRFDVQNVGGGPTALIVNGKIDTTCSNQLEQGGRQESDVAPCPTCEPMGPQRD